MRHWLQQQIIKNPHHDASTTILHIRNVVLMLNSSPNVTKLITFMTLIFIQTRLQTLNSLSLGSGLFLAERPFSPPSSQGLSLRFWGWFTHFCSRTCSSPAHRTHVLPELHHSRTHDVQQINLEPSRQGKVHIQEKVLYISNWVASLKQPLCWTKRMNAAVWRGKQFFSNSCWKSLGWSQILLSSDV